MDAPATGPNQHGTGHEQPHLQQNHDESHQHQQGQTGVWTNPNPPLPRGRAPKDPDAVVTKYDCANLQELETKLKEYLDDPPAPEEHCSAELTLWAGASFLVNIPTGDRQPSHMRPADAGILQPVVDALHANTGGPAAPSALYGAAAAGPARVTQETLSVLDALQPMPDAKDTMKRQRAISKVCIAAISKVDGFRYSFHNNWKSGEDNAYRFSYYCNDSLLNKDRVANGKAGSSGGFRGIIAKPISTLTITRQTSDKASIRLQGYTGHQVFCHKTMRRCLLQAHSLPRDVRRESPSSTQRCQKKSRMGNVTSR